MDEMSKPVDAMDVDEMEEEDLPMSPTTARLFYERAKKMHEDYVKLSEEKIQSKEDEVWRAYNDAEYYKSQIDEEKEMLKDMTTNRDVFRHDCAMWHDRYDKKAADFTALATKYYDEEQKLKEMTDLYNEADRMKHEVEGQLKRADKDRDKAIADFKDMKIKWQTQLDESRKQENEKKEWKKKYEDLIAQNQTENAATPLSQVDPQELNVLEKRLKEGVKMSINELETLNLKLMRDNQCYHKANRELMGKLALAKAPAEVVISRHGTCYHALGCGHAPGDSSKFRKCKDCLP